MPPLRIVGVAPGDPFHPLTWSGGSARLFGALNDEGALAGAVSASSHLLDRVEQAASFSRDSGRWRQRYWAGISPVSGFRRAALGALGARRAAAVDPRPDALLQIGAWFDARGGPEPRLRCSYHDMNLALFLTRSDSLLDPGSRAVRAALARERRTVDRLDLIFTMSEWLRESFVEQMGQAPEKVVTVGAGANVPLPDTPPERRNGPPRFLFVGKRFERKGGPALLSAFEQVRGEMPGAELWIAGPDLPDPGRAGVRWLGPIDRSTPAGDAEIERLYREATAFVMPSVFEPVGYVFAEAMSFGLPCIGTRCCAMPELIGDGVSGLLAAPGDVDDLAARMLELAGDPAAARRMGLEGHRRAKTRFSWEIVARGMIAEIEARLTED